MSWVCGTFILVLNKKLFCINLTPFVFSLPKIWEIEENFIFLFPVLTNKNIYCKFPFLNLGTYFFISLTLPNLEKVLLVRDCSQIMSSIFGKHLRFEWARKHILFDKHSLKLAASIVPASPGRARAKPCRNCRDR